MIARALKGITAFVAQRLGKEKVAGPKVWNYTGIPAQGFESSLRVSSIGKLIV